jgi:hypothetical protein
LKAVAVSALLASPGTPGAFAAGAPTGAQLLNSCEHALARGFHGLQGKMCRWYVTPCDCTASRPGLPQVCLPPGAPVRNLASQVVAGLKSEPGLRRESAAFAAHTILARRYPCAGVGSGQ